VPRTIRSRFSGSLGWRSNKPLRARVLGSISCAPCSLVAIELRQKLGCVGVVVDAKPGAENYYSRFGFVELEVIEGVLEERPIPKPMFLALSAVATALRSTRPKRSD